MNNCVIDDKDFYPRLRGTPRDSDAYCSVVIWNSEYHPINCDYYSPQNGSCVHFTPEFGHCCCREAQLDAKVNKKMEEL